MESYHSDSIDLIRNIELESLVLGLIVVGVKVLYYTGSTDVREVCDSILLLRPSSQGSSCIESIKCHNFTSLRG